MCTAHNALPGECVLRICICVYVYVRICMDGRAECDTRCHTARRGKIIAFAKQRTAVDMRRENEPAKWPNRRDGLVRRVPVLLLTE